MQEKELWPLFSKPVFKTYIDVSDVQLEPTNWIRNYENYTSESHYILDLECYRDLKEQINTEVQEYFRNIMHAVPELDIYITESWINKTEKDQHHHRHRHPNSILSGVLYLQTESDTGEITFVSSKYDMVEIEQVDSNIYNSRSWSVIPESGMLLIFPSDVEHMVGLYLGDRPRISLSFNTFVKGKVNWNPLMRLEV